MKALLSRLEHSKQTWFLLIVGFLFFLLRLPSLFEPYWYGDEGIYEVIGQAIHSGRLLYTQIWDNKPPFLYLMYALVNGDQFSIRLLSLVFGLGALIVFYFLAKQLFKRPTIAMLATTVFCLLFGLPSIEGNIANAENFMLFFILLAALLVFQTANNHLQNKKPYTLIFAGLLLGVAFLFKIVSLFDFAAFFVFLFLVDFSKQKLSSGSQIKQAANHLVFVFIPRVLPFIISFFIPLVITCLFFLSHGAFSTFLKATFFSNIGYVGYGNTFIIPQGLLILKLLFLALFLVFLFFIRRKLSLTSLFMLTWIAFSLFDLFFSQRPYTHYLLVFLIAFCLGIGYILYLKNKARLIFTIVFLGLTILILKSFTLYSFSKTFAYYPNFISYITGNKTTDTYQRFFDQKTPRDYTIASYITLHHPTNNIVYLWSNSAQIYSLSHTLPPGRYTVAYHVNSDAAVKETQAAIETSKPQFIFLFPDVGNFPFMLTNYHYKETLSGVAIYERTD